MKIVEMSYIPTMIVEYRDEKQSSNPDIYVLTVLYMCTLYLDVYI